MILFVFLCIVCQAHADHFDLVSRRMGFIPLPLGSLVSYAVSFTVTIVTITKRTTGSPCSRYDYLAVGETNK